jgi:hypothetical protein
MIMPFGRNRRIWSPILVAAFSIASDPFVVGRQHPWLIQPIHSNLIPILNERNGKGRRDGTAEEEKDVGKNGKPNNLRVSQ